MLGNSLGLDGSFAAHFLKKIVEGTFMEPFVGIESMADRRQISRSHSGNEVAQNAGLPQYFGAVAAVFDHEHPLVYNVAHAVHDSGTAEVEPGRLVVADGIVAGAVSKM